MPFILEIISEKKDFSRGDVIEKQFSEKRIFEETSFLVCFCIRRRVFLEENPNALATRSVKLYSINIFVS